MRRRVTLFCGGLILACAIASAQNLEKFVVTGEAAKHILTKTEISADTAAKIVQACVDFAKAHNVAVSVFVISPQGQIVHAHRMDGQTPINTETGLMKAQSVLYTRTSSHDYANRITNNLSTTCAYRARSALSSGRSRY